MKTWFSSYGWRNTKSWSCPVCRNYSTSGCDIVVDENVAKHKEACWDQRRVMVCTRCSKTRDVEDLFADNCDGMRGWLSVKHNWVALKGGKMDTTKMTIMSKDEEMIAEFTGLVERLYEVEGSTLCWTRFGAREEQALRSLRARVEALELAKKENDERERLKGIVREVLAEARDGSVNSGFDPTGTIGGNTQNPLTTDKA
jgi:hypothetical protein